MIFASADSFQFTFFFPKYFSGIISVSNVLDPDQDQHLAGPDLDPNCLQRLTHSMARHRKSPRSQRYLMVFDPLTPSQGHQFDPRVKISVYPGLLLIPFNLICHMTMTHDINPV